MRQLGRIASQEGPCHVEVRGREAHVLSNRLEPTGELLSLDEVEFLCPVTPTKILGVGRNYHKHAQEMGGHVPKQPLLFLKPPSSLLPNGESVVLPRLSQRVDYEAELAVVIGTRAHKLQPETALDHVLGYTVVCDVTARDLQKADGQWARAKGFDTFCPIASLVTQGIDPASLHIELKLNGTVKQSGNTSDMIFGVRELVTHISQAMTLKPGDLIATGTPEGVGPLSAGDAVEITIENVGRLSFGVTSEQVE